MILRLAPLLWCVSGLQAQSAVLGHVRDSSDRSLHGVTITLSRSRLPTRSDSSGRFEFRGLEPGTYQLIAQRLGYAPDSTAVTVGERDVAYVRLIMEPVAATLASVSVVARRELLPRVYDRIEKRHGAMLFAEDIPRYKVGTVDDLLRAVPRFLSILETPGSPIAKRSAFGTRCGDKVVFLDGRRIPPPLASKSDMIEVHLSDYVPLENIEAIEVHQSADFLKESFLVEGVGDVHTPASRTIGPIALGRNPPPMGGLGLGSCRRVVLIWTKGYKQTPLSGERQ